MLSVDKLRRTELCARERELSVLMSVVEVLLRLHHSNTAEIGCCMVSWVGLS